MYVVVGYHGLDNQCIVVQMANMTRVSFTEGDIFHLTSSLLGRPLVGRAHGRNRPFHGLSEVAVLGSSRLPGEIQSAEDGSDFARRSSFSLILIGLGAPVADVVLEVSSWMSFSILSLRAMHSSVVWPTSLWYRQYLFWFLFEWSHRIESGRLDTPVCFVAKNTSLRDLVRLVKLLYLLRGGLGIL